MIQVCYLCNVGFDYINVIENCICSLQTLICSHLNPSSANVCITEGDHIHTTQYLTQEKKKKVERKKEKNGTEDLGGEKKKKGRLLFS